MQRLTVVLMVVLCTCAATAEELYILPVAQRVANESHSWWSVILVTNPHRYDVTISEVQVFGRLASLDCEAGASFMVPAVLRARETRRVCVPLETFGAIAFAATDTVVVTAEIVQHGRAFPWPLTVQQVEPGRRWVGPHDVATIYGVEASDVDPRTNLFIVNPNAYAIRVTYRSRRMAVDEDPLAYEEVAHDFEVPAGSAVLQPLREAPTRQCGWYRCGPLKHVVRVTGTGKFFVAASTLLGDDAIYRNAVVE